MWRGLYTAATGMITETQRTDVIANNIANAATTGYKRDTAVHREFHNMLIKRVYDHEQAGTAVGMNVPAFNSLSELQTNKDDVTQVKGFNADPFYRPSIGELGLGDYIDEIAVDYTQGAMETTGNPFDLAIAGNGFFAIQTPNGVRYTRNGAFFKNQQGILQDIRGYNLLDTGGNPIRVPANIPAHRFLVTGDGTIYVTGNNVQENDQGQAMANGNQNNQLRLAQIQFVQFNDRLATEKQGDNLFYAVTDNEGNVAQPVPATGEILQGILEKSNTAIVSEMVELIHNHRMYEAGAKAVTTQDTMLDASVNQVGRIGS